MLLIDTHMHIRACFDRSRLFDTAHRNLRLAAADLGSPEDFHGVLMLTESAQENAFGELSCSAPASVGDWWIEPTAEPCSLLLSRGSARLVLIAGQQVETAEGLEVSVLAMERKIRDGQPLNDILALGESAEGVLVLPWAPGKWFFGRGRLLDELLATRPNHSFFLGDNGGRPTLWPTPAHIRRGLDRGFRVLPGSDPLPFRGELARAGSFGAVLRAELDLTQPAASIRKLLADPELRPERFGRLASPVSFLWKELTMQATKRKRKRMAPVMKRTAPR